jgi:hypothetical protein
VAWRSLENYRFKAVCSRHLLANSINSQPSTINPFSKSNRQFITQSEIP